MMWRHSVEFRSDWAPESGAQYGRVAGRQRLAIEGGLQGGGVNVALDSSLSARREFLHVWVSKVSEIIGSSPTSFESAARSVVARANLNLRGITGIEVVEKQLKVEAGTIAEYRVRLRLSFDVAPRTESHW